MASVLDREIFSESEAARILRVAPSTLHYWLEGGARRSKAYRPIIRVEPLGGHAPVTWAEFVEAGLLREYRRTHGVPMAELRQFIDSLRERMGTPYPLAHYRPFVADRQLLVEAQEEARLDAEFCLVAEVRGQLILTPPSEAFVHRVRWEGDEAVEWRPIGAELGSPVRVSPLLRFGRPAVKGISTDALWEHHESGETDDEIAEAYDLTPRDVRWALAYEAALKAA